MNINRLERSMDELIHRIGFETRTEYAALKNTLDSLRRAISKLPIPWMVLRTSAEFGKARQLYMQYRDRIKGLLEPLRNVFDEYLLKEFESIELVRDNILYCIDLDALRAHVRAERAKGVGEDALFGYVEEYWDVALKGRIEETVRAAMDGEILFPSKDLVAFLKDYEDFSSTLYVGADIKNYTIGYGHAIPKKNYDGRYDNGITEAEAQQLLMDDIRTKAQELLDEYLGKNSTVLNQHQYDALISFTFNTGPDWINRYRDLRNILESGNITREAMYREFMDWIIADGKRVLGLYRRRIDELDMFFNKDYNRKDRTKPEWFDKPGERGAYNESLF